jgi:hypothetical protein
MDTTLPGSMNVNINMDITIPRSTYTLTLQYESQHTHGHYSALVFQCELNYVFIFITLISKWSVIKPKHLPNLKLLGPDVLLA